MFILCFSADTEMENWKLEGRRSEAASVVKLPVQAGSLWSLWYRIRITHIYSTWITFTANNRFSCTNCLYILIKSFELFFDFSCFFYKCRNSVNITNSIIMHWADWAHIITFCTINHSAGVIHKYVLKHFNLQAVGVILSFVLVLYLHFI